MDGSSAAFAFRVMSKFKLRSKFAADVFRVGFAQAASFGLMALLLRVMADWLGKAEMGTYLVLRRFVGVVASVALLGLDVGLTRYVAKEPDKARSYLGWGVLLTTLGSILLIVCAGLGDELIAHLTLRDAGLAPFILPAVLFLSGTLTFTVLYAYLRGEQRIQLANRLQLTYYGIWVGIAFVLSLVSPGTSDMLIVYLCITALVTVLAMNLFLLREGFDLRLAGSQFRDLMRFGLPRLPSGFFLNATFSMPLLVAAWRGNLEAAALLGLSLSSVRLLEPLANPLSVILLPKFVELMRETSAREIRAIGRDIVSAALYATTFVVVMAPGLAPEVVDIWFGPKYLAAVPVTRIILVATGFYVAYIILRGMLDAITVFPIVTVLTTLSMVTVAVVSYFARSEVGLGVGMLAAFFSLGAGALAAAMYALRVVPEKRAWLGIGLTLGASLVIFPVDALVSSWPVLPLILTKLIVRSLVAVALAAMHRRMRVPWFSEVLRRLPVLSSSSSEITEAQL